MVLKYTSDFKFPLVYCLLHFIIEEQNLGKTCKLSFVLPNGEYETDFAFSKKEAGVLGYL